MASHLQHANRKLKLLLVFIDAKMAHVDLQVNKHVLAIWVALCQQHISVQQVSVYWNKLTAYSLLIVSVMAHTCVKIWLVLQIPQIATLIMQLYQPFKLRQI